jgi:2-O-(6-phospho-alpha-D-mannosyl)-D-glycerate hydrolase
VDEGDVGDLYDFCPTSEAPARALRIMPGDAGSLVATGPGVRVELRAESSLDAVTIGGSIRNDAADHRLRLHVGLDERAEGSVALAPFEVVERPLRSEGGTEPPSPTWPARGAASAGGVAVFRPGVFEYEILPDPPELAVTLLRCVGTISRPGFDTRKGPAGPDIATPEAQMIGEYVFRLSIRRNVSREALPSAWEEHMLPLRALRSESGGDLPDRGSLLEIDGAELSSVRRIAGAIEARIWNPSMEPRTARVADREVVLGPARIETVRLP